MPGCRQARLLFRHQPDVAVPHLVAVTLQVDGPRAGTFRLLTSRRPPKLAVVDQHAVVADGHSGIGHLLVTLELRRREVEIVRLPNHRRQAHVHVRFPHLVEAAALVVAALQTKRVEHLTLVAVVDVDAAVGAPLASGLRHPRQAEFQVQPITVELLLGGNPGQQALFLGQFVNEGASVNRVNKVFCRGKVSDTIEGFGPSAVFIFIPP